MKALFCVAVLAALVVACVSFGLEDRRFRCDGETNTCDPGYACGPDGYCVLLVTADAPTGDVLANDGATGEVCANNIDDDNDGATDCGDVECPGEATCGIGCVCPGGNGVPTELACGDGIDNDLRDGPDCQDPDCPSCAGALMCCADGACRPSC